jgi:hypothetical protein
MEMMKGVFKKMGDLFSICSNDTLFITFLVSLKNTNKINGILQYWAAFYIVHPVP